MGMLEARPWGQWYPEVLALVLFVQGIYLLLVGPLRRRYGWSPTGPTRAQILWFSMGMFAIFLAEGTPLHTLSEQHLFSAHMTQHILLTLVMPPLVLLGIPAWLLAPLLQRPGVMRIARIMTHPVIAFALFNIIYSLWHLPLFYEAALYNHNLHIFQHATLISTAFLMWWPLLSPTPALPRLSEAGQVIYIFVLLVAQLPVFAPISFGYTAFYSPYVDAPAIWSLSPHADQQLGGAIMKVGGMAVFLFALTVIFFRWASKEEKSVRRSR